MKLITGTPGSIKHFFVKILFSLQVITTCAALPILYCVGVSHNVKQSSKYIIVRTNKGKVSVELEGTGNKAVNNNP